MVYRIFVEKKPGLDNEARELRKDARTFLGIRGLEKVRLLNRYDAEDMPEELFNLAVREVFSEPQLDDTSAEPDTEGAAAVFAVEYLPGQFDQRADSAAQCVQFISRGKKKRLDQPILAAIPCPPAIPSLSVRAGEGAHARADRDGMAGYYDDSCDGGWQGGPS